jgi:hypothetical protein
MGRRHFVLSSTGTAQVSFSYKTAGGRSPAIRNGDLDGNGTRPSATPGLDERPLKTRKRDARCNPEYPSQKAAEYPGQRGRWAVFESVFRRRSVAQALVPSPDRSADPKLTPLLPTTSRRSWEETRVRSHLGRHSTVASALEASDAMGPPDREATDVVANIEATGALSEGSPPAPARAGWRLRHAPGRSGRSSSDCRGA